MRRDRQQFRRAKRRKEEMTEEKFITKPCRNCLNEECAWKGTADNFKLCEDYKVDLSKATNPEFIPKSVLEDIRAKIEDEEDFAYADFDAYNEEILGFDDTDICERDLCHIGLSRAIQIIDKHISGKESRHDKKRSN